MGYSQEQVLDLFKDNTKQELKDGITLQDINKVANSMPNNNKKLQSDIQKAYNLICEKSKAELKKLEESRHKPAPTTTVANSIINDIPTVGGKQETTPQSNMPSAQEMKNIGEQLATMYNESQKQENKEQQKENTSTDENKTVSFQEYAKMVEEYKSQLEEKDNNIDMLKAYNNQMSEKNVKEESSDLLVAHLKETIRLQEQKNSYLLQEIGKLKGMLGM